MVTKEVLLTLATIHLSMQEKGAKKVHKEQRLKKKNVILC